MKIVFLNEKDVAVLKACTRASVQKDRSMDDLLSLRDALEKLDISEAEEDLSKCSKEMKEYEFENAELSAVKRLLREGRQSLVNMYDQLDASIRCHERLEAAVDKKEEDDKDSAKAD